MSETDLVVNTAVDPNAFVAHGRVSSCKDGIIEIVGLHDVMAGEVVVFVDKDVSGMVINLEKNSVKAIVLGDDIRIGQNDLVTATGSLLYVPVGSNMLGRVVDTLGAPIDAQGGIEYNDFSYIDTKAPGIIPRKSVHESMATGILAIDSAISIGRGQR
jgi:F-type H+-transporting ATPase subunit alpha